MGLKYGDGLEVDHKNRDKLDNRRSNLRIADRFMQNQNRSKRGYYFDKWSGKWRAEITVNGIKYRLGRFVTESEAIAAVKEFSQ